MASDESMTVVSSLQDDEYDDLDVGFHPHNLSRLSMYTNDGDDYDDDDDHMGMSNDMSRLSIESFDADVDGDFSAKKFLELSSDSDQEPSCYSLPATPPRRRNRTGILMVVKDYASENESQKGGLGRLKGRSGRGKNPRKRRVTREKWAEVSGGKSESKKKDGDLMAGYSNYSGSFSGESEGGGVVVITRPKGGNRSLCMDLEEVKACRDLVFRCQVPLLIIPVVVAIPPLQTGVYLALVSKNHCLLI
ncbi:uncharacterized protein LOC120173644 isoform X2 [Hibiscus syriacus]|uniref:uncharacterized protein LOC120173644 isoform X2 n=1 Tax=Hibiscus syriacus TaxID=106335 RepID=UPI00192175CE|nr:uncharacterized protein LOC120173644 isoform X2 [Hibiscus syriacus]